MLLPAQHPGPSLNLIEAGLTTIVFMVAFGLPGLGNTWFSRIERAFTHLARKKRLSVAVIGVAAFLLRLAILPLCPAPHPYLTNDFSFLLAADTFSSGRLTNPMPAMWTHFETIHVTMHPTYQSMYFPAQGLVLAAGKLLTGHPWFGTLCITALMCAAICWMLQAWLPPTWALLGGALAILRLDLFSYWGNTYSGGSGSFAALGGALVLGALPRLMKTFSLRDALWMATGFILLGTCRPYDGMLLCLPVAFVLVRWIFFGKNRPAMTLILRRTAIPIALIIAAGAWMGYYNYRAFGSPSTLPYTADRAQYAIAPYFIWQSERPEPHYRQAAMRDFYYRNELEAFRQIHSLSGFIPETILKAIRGLLFYSGIALLIPLIMLRRVLLDRRMRFLIVCVLILIAGQAIEIFLVPHYLAPFTAAFYAIGLQAMRHMRLWKPGRQPIGLTLVRLIVTICVALAGVRVFAGPLHLTLPSWPNALTAEWYGINPQAGIGRVQIETRLEQTSGPQLVLVRYAPNHQPSEQWVYNAADIDRSKVIWAWDMGDTENQDLLHYYKDRTVWLVEPDTTPATLTPYPAR